MGELSNRHPNVIGKINLTFEDFFLNFPDRAGDEELSNLRRRDEDYDRLSDAEFRIFVTVGHNHFKYELANRHYIRKLREQGKKIRIVFKPTSGMYNVLKKSGLLHRYQLKRAEGWGATKPPKEKSEEHSGHSAPGRLLLIAEQLIKRADRILDGATTVPDCIHGAILALEAQELLGYRTATTSLTAISLLHKLEVKAECMFYGVEYNKEVKERFREIRGQVEAVTRWVHPSIRTSSALNAGLEIVKEVRTIFQDFGQFDEENQCLSEERTLYRNLKASQSWLGKIARPFLWYFHIALSNFWVFLVFISLWIILPGVWYSQFSTNYDAFRTSASAFLDFHNLIEKQEWWNGFHWLFFIQGASGLVHLGIFISYVFMKVARRSGG